MWQSRLCPEALGERISDSDSKVGSFADDTKVLKGISSIEDEALLQRDLETLFTWADKYNMKFNGDKFVLLRYSKNREINESNYRLPGNVELAPSTSTRDLGIEMSSSGDFDAHVGKLSLSCRRLVGMLFRSFQNKDAEILLPVYKALVLSKLDYCSILWTPKTVTQLRLVEEIQAVFTRRLVINGVKGTDMDYWQRLECLRLYSVQRRHERYAIMYIWKILNKLVHNPGLVFEDNVRRGTWCKVDRYSSPLREASFLIWGPRVFNATPKEIRDFRPPVTSKNPVDSFKRKLDKFLSQVPDKPNLSQEYSSRINTVDIRGMKSNSLIDLI